MSIMSETAGHIYIISHIIDVSQLQMPFVQKVYMCVKWKKCHNYCWKLVCDEKFKIILVLNKVYVG